MNHKYKKPKAARAGCLMCKPQKHNAINDETEVYHHGFGKIRALDAAKRQLKEY